MSVLLLIWFGACFVLGIGVVAILAVVSTRRGEWGTSFITPVVADPGKLTMRLVGGANVPTKSMRINGSFPFGVLEVFDHAVKLRFRPSWLGGVVLLSGPTDITRIYPLRALIGSRGIGITLRDGREWYFRSRRVKPALAALRAAGFPVSDKAERAAKVWSVRP